MPSGKVPCEVVISLPVDLAAKTLIELAFRVISFFWFVTQRPLDSPTLEG
jgi:hypothetical protein